MRAIASEIDDPARDALENVWGELKAVFGLPGMAGVSRPRFLLHAADAYDDAALSAVVARIAGDTAPLAAASAGLGLYRGPRTVLALALHREGALGALHGRLWSALAPLSRGVRGEYAAATWAPHITLAAGDLGGAPLDVISEFIARRPFAGAVPVTNLCLVEGAGGGAAARRFPLGRVTSP